MKNYILVIISILVATNGLAQLIIPDGYSHLKTSPANGKTMNVAQCFIDDDDLPDYADIVVKTNAFSTYKLIIYISSQQKQYEFAFHNPDDLAIYPMPLEVNNNVLTMGYYSDGTAAFGCFFKLRYHNSKQVQIIGYDSEYRLPNGYINKSYNLLTGDYNVMVQKIEDGTEKVNRYQGNTNPITAFLNDLNFDTLYQLDDVGSEFEL